MKWNIKQKIKYIENIQSGINVQQTEQMKKS